MDESRYVVTRPGPSRTGIVVIGASLGGPTSLLTLLAGLPADFPVPIAIVQHRAASYPSGLSDLLQRRTALHVVDAGHGSKLQPGTVHVAPEDAHMLVQPGGRLALSHSERHSFARPSVDLLFTSTAEVYRERAIGVVLTGKQQDGAAGAWALKAMGGRVITQDPATCQAADMPNAAIRSGAVDFVVPLDRIADVLITLVVAPGAASLFRVPVEASLARARRLWGDVGMISPDPVAS